MQDQIVDLRWEVAVDESFRSIVQHGVANVAPELGHSAHVEVIAGAGHWPWLEQPEVVAGHLTGFLRGA